MFLGVVSPGGPHLITEAYSTHFFMIPAPSRGDKPASYDTCLAMIPVSMVTHAEGSKRGQGGVGNASIPRKYFKIEPLLAARKRRGIFDAIVKKWAPFF